MEARLSRNATGFIAGGLGLLGRDLLIFLSVENWWPIVGWELLFASIIAGGFLHTVGFAAIGVVIACVAGSASATCFIVLTGGQPPSTSGM